MKLNIVQMNDSHAYIGLHNELFLERGGTAYRPAGGYGRIAAILNEIRRESSGDTLFCDCGDTLHGTFPAQNSSGEAVVPLLNKIHPAAMTAHWEFAYGPAQFQNLASKMKFPVLAANVFRKNTGAALFPSSTVAECAGLRIGLIGLTSNIVDKTMPPSFSEGLEFKLGHDELTKAIGDVRSQGADLVILLSHLGFPQDIKMLSEVSGVDVCLSGHTHDRLAIPTIVNGTIVIQSGRHGSFLGHLKIELDGGRIIDYNHRLIEVSKSIKPDREIQSMIDETLAPLRDCLCEIVGTTHTPLDRWLVLESTMDNLLLESILEATGAQFGFSNGWRYGAPISPGPVTVNDLHNIAPMNPPVSTAKLTGEEIIQMLEENLELTFASDPFQRMGGYVKRCLGLKVYFKIENPSGHRIIKCFAGNEELRLNASYACAFVTEQGVPRKYGTDRAETSLHTMDTLRSYLEKHSPVATPILNTFVPA